ncbi:alpha/beta hydrolase [Staphylococcus agnetis]|uniref:alpha/beta hydrolase n=2 Tax=Staphylococcus agnetis TaxID=985762 RepID=UPI00208ECE10|nr:alpha/beta hydrolase [Staphylococcus agnetis]MCO4346660.1 alpha/beta hydrolase [Staphylococcus agnetis]MCO4356135.1 alpha/beta hydrolase [Staphylococcus agnetis]MCO4372670.1 alpha/beta hydrolase [Staphylococcus agnetis]
MMKHLQSLGKVALGTTTALTASLYTLNQLTPMPGVILSKILFNQPSKKAYIKDTVRQDARFKQIASRVTSLYDVVYDSTERTGLMDIYMPNGDQETYPTLFWVHGGGYMSGDKSDVTPYLQLLASEGYTVVNLNYALVPEARYPEPIYSLEKAYVAVQKNAQAYKADFSHVAFGGDSAGGQIIGQFINIQVNDAYRDTTAFKQTVPPETIKTAIFYSSLLNTQRMDKTDDMMANKLFSRLAWAYFDDKHWRVSPKTMEASVTLNMDHHFPPSYITDAKHRSFEDQARQFVATLEHHDIPVEGTFYDSLLYHEYQFDMSLYESKVNYERLVHFLKQHLAK